MIYIDRPIPVGCANLISPYREKAHFIKRKLGDNNMKDVLNQKSYKKQWSDEIKNIKYCSLL